MCGIHTVAAQAPDQPLPKKVFIPETDVSIGIDSQLTDTRMPTTTAVYTGGIATTQITQGTSPSAGVLGTFHQSFKPWLGYNVNFGYTRFSENYSHGEEFTPNTTSALPANASFKQGSIRTSMYELTIAYRVEGPRTRRFSTFGQFGGGGLFFNPANNPADPKEQTRPAMVFGVGMNYKLTSHLDLRAEYRGLFYKSPDFNLPPFDGYDFPTTRLFAVTSAPAMSLVYRFGGRAKTPNTAVSREEELALRSECQSRLAQTYCCFCSAKSCWNAAMSCNPANSASASIFLGFVNPSFRAMRR
jgi:opacity protein-like surface antigen